MATEIELNDVYITYYLSGKHSEYKNAMKERKYRDRWIHNDTKNVHYLPNTCLWRPDTTLEQAKKDLQEVLEEINKEIKLQKDKIRFERLIYLRFHKAGNWNGITGDPHA